MVISMRAATRPATKRAESTERSFILGLGRRLVIVG